MSLLNPDQSQSEKVLIFFIIKVWITCEAQELKYGNRESCLLLRPQENKMIQKTLALDRGLSIEKDIEDRETSRKKTKP